jgi:hypothetical protein
VTILVASALIPLVNVTFPNNHINKRHSEGTVYFVDKSIHLPHQSKHCLLYKRRGRKIRMECIVHDNDEESTHETF